MTRDILDELGSKIGELTLPDDTDEAVWLEALSAYVHQQVSAEEVITNRIKYYESIAPQLLREIKAANTLAGITAAESDAMMDDFQDVLLRIREGMFPTALYRLQQKSPVGFVDQDMIDLWTALIRGYL